MPPKSITLLSRAGALLWLLVIAGICVWLLIRFSGGPVLNADLISLLPGVQQEPAIRAAAKEVSEVAERKIAFLVSASDEGVARQAATFVFDRLSESKLFVRLELQRDPAALRQLGSLYFPYRFQLLSPQTRQELLAERQEDFQRRLMSRYLNPLGGLSSGLIEGDPLLLLPDYLASLAPQGASKLQINDGFLVVQEENAAHVLLLADLAGTPFSIELQDDLAPRLQRLRREVDEDYPGAGLLVAGVFPHAAAGTASARREVSVVGGGSLVGIFVLFILVFRSIRPFLMGALAVVVGCLGGFVACLAVFGQVHLMTLVFGASLVGISVDYSLHYFCERMADGEQRTSHAVLRSVFPGITLGLVTSVVGFAGVLIAPFPGMREMAVFSSVGLISAWLCVVLFYPVMAPRAGTGDGLPLKWAAAYSRLWERDRKGGALIGLMVILAVAAVGCLKLSPLDDFRMLQTHDPEVVADEERVRHLLGQDHAGQFLLVSGDDEAMLLEREEAFIADLQSLLEGGELGGYTALSQFVPSPARQEENRALIAPLISEDSTTFQELSRTVGLPETARRAYASALRESDGQPPLSLHQWLASPASAPFRYLWLGGEGAPMSVIPLSGLRNAAALREAAESHEGVEFIDRVQSLSDVFNSYRTKTLWLTVASYLVVALLLAVRYGRRGALSVIVVPMAAALVSFGALGFLSEPISLFNIIALLLILGIGVDYGIFFREAGLVRPATLLAVAMSALTTIMAFGLLSVSATTAVHSFGLTLLLGISAAFFLSPLAAILFPSHSSHRATGVVQ